MAAYRVYGTVTVHAAMELVVEADSEDEAMEKAENTPLEEWEADDVVISCFPGSNYYVDCAVKDED